MTLRLPNNYVEVERDGMYYLDGRYKYTSRWYEFDYNLSPSECADMPDELTHLSIIQAGTSTIVGTIAGVLGGSVGIVSAASSAIADIITSGNAAYVASKLNTASRKSGATLIKQRGAYSVNI